jgi:hypothetical protein
VSSKTRPRNGIPLSRERSLARTSLCRLDEDVLSSYIPGKGYPEPRPGIGYKFEGSAGSAESAVSTEAKQRFRSAVKRVGAGKLLIFVQEHCPGLGALHPLPAAYEPRMGSSRAPQGWARASAGRGCRVSRPGFEDRNPQGSGFQTHHYANRRYLTRCGLAASSPTRRRRSASYSL